MPLFSRGALARAGAVASAASFLAACAGSSPGGPAAPGASKPPVSLRWSTWGDEANPMVEGAAKGIDLFRQKFPNVTIRAEAQVDTPGGPSWSQKNFTGQVNEIQAKEAAAKK